VHFTVKMIALKGAYPEIIRVDPDNPVYLNL
jgi:hypothetical protein